MFTGVMVLDWHYSGARPPYMPYTLRLRILQAGRDLARRQITATVAMVFLSTLGDVDGLVHADGRTGGPNFMV
jgi:hypothetical protein